MSKRSRGAGRRKAARRPISELVDDMETPLSRAEDLVRALEYVGYGLSSHEDDSAPAVFGLSQAMSDNLAVLKRQWMTLSRVAFDD
jgi:hypothetical protein